ncbi:MAG: phosphoribosyltransferase family protein [Caldilineaceae bacterium]
MKEYYTWEQITDLVRVLTNQLNRDDYDAVLAITRGGMIPGCLVSEWLDLRNVMTAAVMFYTVTEQTLDEPRFLQFPADPLLYGKRILLVDDVWDSGKTVMAVKQRVHEAGGHPTVAVIHYKPTASRFPADRPDFYAQETDAWIVYPWEP